MELITLEMDTLLAIESVWKKSVLWFHSIILELQQPLQH